MSRAVKSPGAEDQAANGQIRRRRQPVQARSRETVERILEAADAFIEEGGLDAVTTRNVAERAGITPPSLYRFFADREQVLDALIEQHLERLGAFLAEAEQRWAPGSAAEFVARELDTFAAYFKGHHNMARLWFDGRVSPTVRAEVGRYQHRTAQRLHALAISAGFATACNDPRIFVLAVELGDRVLDLAFRERNEPDPHVIRHGHTALTAYLEAALRQ
ncbi:MULTISPECIES: TetR/AcrR family transcriptional regulator [Actinospica]|uniref:TetR/AcrR family transcriptional regulator n=1 Tax=Actinospica durhamensis TaxID=1508375 RepID=A0A941EMI7_9ACTN|nr:MULTISPECIES: TetR/AcrR family transcriptional regulator [Actinospica]MBR7835145.1 TetR/AcrR family transcriptional regulator [Actinospica durhamensis]